jgi:paraquat-inducible protein A
MLASLSFDPRLIWDEVDPEAGQATDKEQQKKDMND